MATAVIGGLIAAGSAGLAGAAVGGVVAAGVLGGLGGILQDRAEGKREDAAQAAVQEQQKQQAISNAQQQVARTRAIRQSIAESRVRRAEIVSRSFAGGPEGVGQSITGDTASAVGAASTQQAAAFGISRSQDSQAQFSLDARSSNRFDTLAGITGFLRQGITTVSEGGFDGLGSALFRREEGPAPVIEL